VLFTSSKCRLIISTIQMKCTLPCHAHLHRLMVLHSHPPCLQPSLFFSVFSFLSLILWSQHQDTIHQLLLLLLTLYPQSHARPIRYSTLLFISSKSHFSPLLTSLYPLIHLHNIFLRVGYTVVGSHGGGQSATHTSSRCRAIQGQ
jgi:hypothetical protein